MKSSENRKEKPKNCPENKIVKIAIFSNTKIVSNVRNNRAIKTAVPRYQHNNDVDGVYLGRGGVCSLVLDAVVGDMTSSLLSSLSEALGAAVGCASVM